MAIGWGIIGIGRHADLKIVPALRAAAENRVIAAFSRDRGRAEAFARRHELPAAYDTLEALLADPRIDAVYIAAPNFLHAPYTAKAAAAGKHVLVEKPMALDLNEALAMVQACRAGGVKLGVGFHLRHHPGHRQAREWIRQGVLGALTLLQGQFFFPDQRGVTELPRRAALSEWWGRPEMVGGAYAIMGMGVHVIDLLQFLSGVPIVEVAAITNGQTANQPLDDIAVVSLRFQNGTLGTLCCGRRVPDSENDAMVYGIDGRIALRDTVWEPLRGRLEVASSTLKAEESYAKDPLALYRLQAEAFGRAVREGGEFDASGVDGVRVVQVTSAIIESASTGRSVKIDPVDL